MNKKERMDALIDFIQNTSCDTVSENVVWQAKKCFLDLAGVLCAGTKNKTSRRAAEYVAENYPRGEVTILRTGEKTTLIGAALANGMAANALDMDDGYSLLRGHPGSGFFGALLSAGEFSKCSYGEFLSALIVAYETSIREGYAIRHFYGWDHSSGSYSTFGTAASVGKLLGLNRQELEMALGIADFILPVNPAKRSCYVPSMNKDGIFWGQHAGTQAVLMAKYGFTGKNPVILDNEYEKYLESLGKKWYLFDLYIKFYSCCRWAHSPIGALADLMKEFSFGLDNVVKIDVYSFGNAGTLYMEAPTNEDEAQYNIKYPIAAQLLFGNCGPLESSTTKMLDSKVSDVIKKIEFHHELEYDKVFPEKRLSRVEVTLNNGKVLKSGSHEPKGDRNSEVSIVDICEKLHMINDQYASEKMTEDMIENVLNTPMSAPFSTVLEPIKTLAYTNVHPEIEFI